MLHNFVCWCVKCVEKVPFRKSGHICLFELMVPTNTQQHLLAARARKEDQYSSLQYDLQLSGLTIDLVPIEIGC